MAADIEPGPHDVLLATSAPGLGWWVECECGWIGPTRFTEMHARRAHQSHAEAQAKVQADG